MLTLKLRSREAGSLTVLCLGAHSDDIEIGCGGTLLQLKNLYPELKLHWVVFSAAGVRRDEAEKGAELFGGVSLERAEFKEFRDGFLPYTGTEVKNFFEILKTNVNPDLIFTHWSGDAHQDHRLINELTWNTFRNHMILEFEIPKYDGDLGRPSMFVPLEGAIYRQKITHLMTAFHSQRSKTWFSEDTFLSIMRLRGVECASPSGYAEAFHCRKAILS